MPESTTDEPGPPRDHPAPPQEGAKPLRRTWRILRRTLIGLASLLALSAIAAAIYNVATSGYPKPARALYGGPFVDVDGRLVAYRQWGTSGSPIVLIGGGAEPSWVWHKVGPRLAAEHHRVYAIDLPPWGYTEREGPISMDAWLGLLHGFERRVGIERPLLVGHSLGAGVAAADARANPGMSSGIVMLDGDGLAFSSAPGWLIKLWVYPYNPALLRLLAGSDWLVGSVVGAVSGPGLPAPSPAVIDEFQRPFRVEGTARAIRELSSRELPGLTLEQLREVRGPRAVVWGAEDDVDPVAAGRTTADALRVPIQLLPGVGHLTMLSDPAGVAAAIERVARAR